mgnify:FL=1
MKISKQLINDLTSIEKDVNNIESNPQNAKEIIQSITTKIATTIAVLTSVYENLSKLDSDKENYN